MAKATKSTSDWPIAKGRAVVFLDNGMMVHGADTPRVRHGKVVFYNPATEQSSVVTLGRPFYNVAADGGTYLVDARYVLLDRRPHRAQLLRAAAAIWYGRAADHRRQAEACDRRVAQLSAEAEELEK